MGREWPRRGIEARQWRVVSGEWGREQRAGFTTEDKESTEEQGFFA